MRLFYFFSIRAMRILESSISLQRTNQKKPCDLVSTYLLIKFRTQFNVWDAGLSAQFVPPVILEQKDASHNGMYRIRRVHEEWGRDLNRTIMGKIKGAWKFVYHEGKKKWKERSGNNRKQNLQEGALVWSTFFESRCNVVEVILLRHLLKYIPGLIL